MKNSAVATQIEKDQHIAEQADRTWNHLVRSAIVKKSKNIPKNME